MIAGLLLVAVARPGAAASETQISMRLYEARRDSGDVKPSVVSSYYLKANTTEDQRAGSDGERERHEIRRIYNLATVQMISEASWKWSPDQLNREFQTQVVNRRQFTLQLTMLAEKHHFQIEVIDGENREGNTIFESEFNLPQNKTIVFGFEDTGQQTYFISLHRWPDTPAPSEQIVVLKPGQTPRLLKLVRPQYPRIALSSRVQGTVILEVRTDDEGRVTQVTVRRGRPLLTRAAVEAVKQWRYEPYLVEGTPSAAIFNVNVTFQIQ